MSPYESNEDIINLFKEFYDKKTSWLLSILISLNILFASTKSSKAFVILFTKKMIYDKLKYFFC